LDFYKIFTIYIAQSISCILIIHKDLALEQLDDVQCNLTVATLVCYTIITIPFTTTRRGENNYFFADELVRQLASLYNST